MRVDVIDLAGIDAGVTKGERDNSGDRTAFRLRRGRMEGLAAETMAGQFAVDRCAAPPRALEVFEDEDAGAFTDVHARAAAVKWAARFGIHQPQQVEAAERQPRQRIGAARQRGVRPARSNRLDRSADGDRARGARGGHARPRSFEAEALGDGVDRCVGKIVPGVRPPGPLNPGRNPGPEKLLVAQQIGSACSEEDADARAIDPAFQQTGFVDASAAACNPMRSLRDRRRRSSGVEPASSASMSISAATRLRYPSVLKTVAGRTPHSPANIRRQLSSQVAPRAVRAPSAAAALGTPGCIGGQNVDVIL